MLPSHIKLNSDGDRGFFIDLRTGELFKLNATGLRILQCLQSDTPENQIADIIVAEFKVDKTKVQEDILYFLGRIKTLETLQ
ncbi:PqqD family protein [bacterium]|nr:PqqD family protein [bacterium]